MSMFSLSHPILLHSLNKIMRRKLYGIDPVFLVSLRLERWPDAAEVMTGTGTINHRFSSFPLGLKKGINSSMNPHHKAYTVAIKHAKKATATNDPKHSVAGVRTGPISVASRSAFSNLTAIASIPKCSRARAHPFSANLTAQTETAQRSRQEPRPILALKALAATRFVLLVESHRRCFLWDCHCCRRGRGVQ
jgi:hypothetical protein